MLFMPNHVYQIFIYIPKKPNLIQQIPCGEGKDEATFLVPQIDNKIFV